MTVKSQLKFQLFLQNCRLLSDTFDLVPLLYGSAGLEYVTGDDLQADDIDVVHAIKCGSVQSIIER